MIDLNKGYEVIDEAVAAINPLTIKARMPQMIIKESMAALSHILRGLKMSG